MILAVACGFTWYLARGHVDESERVFARLRTETGAAKRYLAGMIESNTIPPLASDAVIDEVKAYAPASVAFATYGQAVGKMAGKE